MSQMFPIVKFATSIYNYNDLCISMNRVRLILTVADLTKLRDPHRVSR